MPSVRRYSQRLKRWFDVEEHVEDVTQAEAYEPDSWCLLISYFRNYPDKLLDVLESENTHYSLMPLQRILMRAEARYDEVFITGSRGTTKTYTIFLAAGTLGILFPGTVKKYFAPSYKQAAEIASNTWQEIKHNYPLMAEHWHVVSDAQERFEIETSYGSIISINAQRGDNAHTSIAEECAQEADTGEPFNHEKYRRALIPATRLVRMVNKERDPFFHNFAKWYITSAGRRQNDSFDYRASTFKDMVNGKSAFCIDIPAEVPVLSGIRDVSWYRDLKRKLTTEEWLREMQSIWTGTTENPVVRDVKLSEAKKVFVAETKHCGDMNAIYIVSYDVSYEDGAGNARCATAVLKCTEQKDTISSNRYKKQLVYVFDSPPADHLKQAKTLKAIWRDFCIPNGAGTYIAIDARAYGTAVMQDLYQDLSDGLPPLRCMDLPDREEPAACTPLRQQGALPVIYPIMASRYGGQHGDSEPDMLRYMELEFEHNNIEILTTRIQDGVESYKQANRIKYDDNDHIIALPYRKTKELCEQIGNLKKKVSGTGITEVRISDRIQRDMWSAFKYAGCVAKHLEFLNLIEKCRQENPWSSEFEKMRNMNTGKLGITRTMHRVFDRMGGNYRR